MKALESFSKPDRVVRCRHAVVAVGDEWVIAIGLQLWIRPIAIPRYPIARLSSHSQTTP